MLWTSDFYGNNEYGDPKIMIDLNLNVDLKLAKPALFTQSTTIAKFF